MQALKVSVAEVLGRPGRFRTVDLARPLEGVAITLSRLRDSEPVSGRLRLESVVEGILVTGKVTAPTVVECSRCLTPRHDELSTDLCELYVLPGRAQGPDDDAYEVDGTDIDLEPMLRDALTLALPLNPVCRDGCRGLCARCGRDLNAGACSCTDEAVDPRWGALDQIKARLQG